MPFFLYKCWCRVFQLGARTIQRFLPWRVPFLLQGDDASFMLPGILRKNGQLKVLLVTSPGLYRRGQPAPLMRALKDSGIVCAIYAGVQPNPDIGMVENGLQMYIENHCQAIIAFGGGSAIDCAKGIGARVARPRRTIPQMQGLLHVRRQIPTLYAIPTTAGTGSEATIAAVLSNHDTHEKYALEDPVLVPHYAVLDPALTVGLPADMTATTGMDALCHAVEALIGGNNTRFTRAKGEEALLLVFQNLRAACADGSNLDAREKMQHAAYLAGLSFTRAYVGNVHAVAHALGAFYNTPHGLAVAVALPLVLEYYGRPACRRLARLARLAGFASRNDSNAAAAQAFIQAIRRLNHDIGIPATLEGIRKEDIPAMAQHAFKEANPLYPVPRIFTRADFAAIFYMLGNTGP